MTTRTDVHRPTALVTEDYDYLFAADTKGPWAVNLDRAFLAELVNFGPADPHPTTNQCTHCGAWLRYVAFLRHVPTGYTITIGEDCLENRFELATADFQKLRKAATSGNKQGRVARRKAEWFAEDPQREVVFNWCAAKVEEGDFGWEGMRHSFVHKVNRYGDTSDKFVAAMVRDMDRTAERAAKIEERKAAEALEVKEPAPTGRTQVIGQVLSTKVVESDFGSTLKMLVKDDRNFKVWCTVPAGSGQVRDHRVTFMVNLEPSKDDPFFAFGKRPTKLQVLN